MPSGHNLLVTVSLTSRKSCLCLLAALAALALPGVALASSIVVSLGNTAPTNPFAGGAQLVSGNRYGSAVISSNFVAPFFTDFCGSEGGAMPSGLRQVLDV